MHKVIKPDGSVEFYRGNKLLCVKLPSEKMTTPAPKPAETPKYPTPRAFKNFKFSRPEMEFRLPEDKS